MIMTASIADICQITAATTTANVYGTDLLYPLSSSDRSAVRELDGSLKLPGNGLSGERDRRGVCSGVLSSVVESSLDVIISYLKCSINSWWWLGKAFLNIFSRIRKAFQMGFKISLLSQNQCATHVFELSETRDKLSGTETNHIRSTFIKASRPALRYITRFYIE